MSTFFECFWIILIIVVLVVPAVRRRMLDASRQRFIRKLEKKRGSRVLTLIHRQEEMRIFGFPVTQSSAIDDAEAVMRAINLTDNDVPIDLIMHTPGSLVIAAEQIAWAMKQHPAKVTVFVPHYAMSGATLIALAADEIVMDENAVLGTIDPQIGGRPAASILKILDWKDPKEIDDETLILTDIAQKALNQVKICALNIMRGRMDDEKAADVAEVLTQGQWTHDYPITVDMARELGIPISSGMPVEICQLMNLFPQPQNRRPSVQYIPMRHESKNDKERRL